MLDRHTPALTVVPLAHAAEKGHFFSTELQTTDNIQDMPISPQKRLVTIIVRMAHAISVQDMHRKLNEVELH